MRARARAGCAIPNVDQLACCVLTLATHSASGTLSCARAPQPANLYAVAILVCRCTGPGGLCGSRRRSLLLPGDCCAGLTCTNSAIKNEDDCATSPSPPSLTVAVDAPNTAIQVDVYPPDFDGGMCAYACCRLAWVLVWLGGVAPTLHSMGMPNLICMCC